jgi:tetratricopeptide (TPR) repeat protein
MNTLKHDKVIDKRCSSRFATRTPQALLLLAALLIGSQGAVGAEKAQGLRPEVGEPLQQAQQLLQGKQYKDALSKVEAAEKVGNLTEYEEQVILQMRAAAALGSGQYGVALSAYEKLYQAGVGDRLQTLETLSRLAYGAKAYGKAAQYISDYQAAGGSKPEVTSLLAQAYYLATDYPKAGATLKQQIAVLQKVGKAPSEKQLELLANVALKQDDMSGYVEALLYLVQYYPTADYWLDLIARTTRQAGFSQRYALDVYRLRQATGTLTQAADYVEAAQLALQAGYPGEAKHYVDAGFAAKVLGQGVEAERHQRLKALIDRKIAEDRATLAEGETLAAQQGTGDALVAAGMNRAGYGDYDKAIALIRQGITKGVKSADYAQLQLGYVQHLAGQAEQARATLAAVKGADGAQALARLWSLS